MKIRFIIIALSLMSLNAHAQKYHYDVNNDGHVTVSDIMLIVNKILGKTDDEPEYPLTISVSQEPIYDPDSQTSSKKKTPETFLSDLTKFYINDTYTYDGLGFIDAPELETHWVVDNNTGKGQWLVGNSTTPGQGYWPSQVANSSTDVSFFAYANVDLTNTDPDSNVLFSCDGDNDISSPKLHFYLEESSADTKDLLVAKTKDNWNNCEGNLSFHFTHACAAVKFFLSKTEKLANNTIKVKKAYLCNVKNEGYYHFEPNDGEYWKDVKFANVNKRMKYTLWDGSSFTDVPQVTTDNPYPWQLTNATTNKDHDYFFFIPQSFGPTVPSDFYPVTETTAFPYIKLELTISGKTSSGSEKSYGTEENPAEAYIPFTIGTLTQGIASNAIISLGTALRDKNGKTFFDQNGNLQ